MVVVLSDSDDVYLGGMRSIMQAFAIVEPNGERCIRAGGIRVCGSRALGVDAEESGEDMSE